MVRKGKVGQNMGFTRKPTVRDIARLANVSIATVSAAFNKGPVSESTRKKVFEAARKLGYRPNLIARSMVTKRTHMIGVVLPWSNIELIDSSVEYASSMKYGVIISISRFVEDGKEESCLEQLMERMVDGIIFLPKQHPAEDYVHMISAVKSAGVKLVLIDRYFREIKVDSVVTDNIKGGYLATKHLIDLGHRRIGFLGGYRGLSSIADRLEGYKKALTEAGIKIDEDLIFFVDIGDDPRELARKILTGRKDITGIFVTSDNITFDIIAEAMNLGVRIPDDVSLVGFDDLLVGHHRIDEMLNPPLTTVRQHFSLMVRKALDLLIDRIEGEEENEDKIIYIEPELIVRKSTRPLL